MSEGNGRTKENGKAHGLPLDFDGGIVTPSLHQDDVIPTEPEKTADGKALLLDTESLFGKYLTLPKGGGLVLSLFSIATHCFKSFDQFPYLVLLSPTKGCGKTRVTEILEGPAAYVVRTAGISEAVLFRLVDAKEPTLVIDEAEPLTGKSERADFLRSLLNSGNRADALVYRCDGPKHDIKGFRVFCPKVMCAIRVCPDTVKDRAIVLSMQKKLPSQKVGRFFSRLFKPVGKAIRERIGRFVDAHTKEIRTAYEGLELDFLPDRDAENWLPLFAVLKVLSPEREKELRSISERLTGQKTAEDEDDSLNLRLLGDVRDVRPEGEQAVLSSELVERLSGLEDSPWHKEIPLDTRKLARMLRPFSIAPRSVRATGRGSKGYLWELLEPVFLAYLAPQPAQAAQCSVYTGPEHFLEPAQEPVVPDEKSEESPMFTQVVPDVPDKTQEAVPERMKEGKKKSWAEGLLCPGCRGGWASTGSLVVHLPVCKPFDIGAMRLTESRLRRGQAVAPELRARYEAYLALGLGRLHQAGGES